MFWQSEQPTAPRETETTAGGADAAGAEGTDTGPAPDAVAEVQDLAGGIPGADSVAEFLNSSLGGLPEWARVLVIAGAFAALLLGAQTVLYAVLGRATRNEGRLPTKRLVEKTSGAARVLAALLGLTIGFGVTGGLGLPSPLTNSAFASTLGALIALTVTWLVIGLVRGADDMILAKHRIDVEDNLKARRMHTQVAVLSRTLMVVIGIFGIGIALMQYDNVERIGTSLLASAGVAGIVLGFAARPVLGNIIAGIQIALTQPIRLEDVVIIDGEWGTIEEITTTYVVVKIWDQRRLIVPFSTIIEQPFENWTRKTSQILGTVYFHADYTLPVDEARAELKRLCEDHPKWDGRVCGLQVTDAEERTMRLRGLVSAKNAGEAWDLRCDMREAMVAWLQREHPGALPRDRQEEFLHDADEEARDG